MRATFREMRRAPVRIAASITAIALAIAAIGIFAVPGVAENTLRDIAAEDRLTHINITTTPFEDPTVVADLEGLAGFEAVEVRTAGTVNLASSDDILVVGSAADAAVDRVRVDVGRYPEASDEALVSPGLAAVGDVLPLPDRPLTVVGVGQTTWLATEDVVFTLPETSQELTGIDGVNTVVARLEEPTATNLDLAVEDHRHGLCRLRLAQGPRQSLAAPDGPEESGEGVVAPVSRNAGQSHALSVRFRASDQVRLGRSLGLEHPRIPLLVVAQAVRLVKVPVLAP